MRRHGEWRRSIVELVLGVRRLARASFIAAPTTVSALLLVAAAIGCSEPRDAIEDAASTESANVLLISIDSLRADHLASYGYHRVTAPHLDRLAREGVLFERMVSDSSWTLPTHLTMLTGLSSWVHGAMFDTRRLDPEIDTLAEILGARGYRSEGFASGPYLHPIFGFADGFDTYELLGRTLYDETGFSLAQLASDSKLFDRMELSEREARRARTSDVLARKVEEALARAGGQPFFIFVHMFDVHYDFDPPEAYWRHFNPDYSGEMTATEFMTDPRVHPDMSPEERAQLMALYDGEILFTDEYIGRMLDALDLYGVADQTLVVVVGDHGEEFFDHGEKGHRHTLYDEQLLVPFIMRLPSSLPAGRRVAMQVRMVDVAPTILDLVGGPPLEGSGGESLLPFVSGERAEVDLPAMSYLYAGSMLLRTLRRSNQKIQVKMPLDMIDRGYRGQVELYDLAADPAEQIAHSEGAQVDAAHAAFVAAFAQEQALRGRSRSGDGGAISLPPAMRRALEQLGYAEGDAR
jgi:arylsulfatase A-like enzyme